MPRIFKAGDYGKKGNYSTDKLKLGRKRIQYNCWTRRRLGK